MALWWNAKQVPDQHDVRLRVLLRAIPKSSGVYAVTGRHDAHSGQAVLYIGQAGNLHSRVPHSLSDSLSELHAFDQRTLTSDVWDLTIRWARLARTLLDPVEKLLIMSHSPPFNSQAVRRRPPPAKDHPYVVMSAGRKGPLLPIVAGAYQAPWQNGNRKVGP